MLTHAGTRKAAPRTIARLWQDAVERRWQRPAYLVQDGDDWREVSWQEAAQTVDEIAHGLLAVGVRKGDVFAILGSTRLEWALVDFALGLIGAVGAGIYANSSPRDVAHVLTHSQAIGVLCEDEEQRGKLGGAAPQHVLTFSDLDDLRARGREHARARPDAVDDAAAAIDPDDLFTFIYTSGTTGPPKACMIRHRNYHAMVAKLDDLDDFLVAGDTMLLYLPLAHNFGR
ncbi:MAG TPA: AMP-binding protein, partial [Gaiellaceae bacterium]|nr:AMP-binding protein [Gaiellaceae bacterium]